MEIRKSVIYIKKGYKIDVLKIKTIVKLEIFVIVQVNKVVLHIVYV